MRTWQVIFVVFAGLVWCFALTAIAGQSQDGSKGAKEREPWSPVRRATTQPAKVSGGAPPTSDSSDRLLPTKLDKPPDATTNPRIADVTANPGFGAIYLDEHGAVIAPDGNCNNPYCPSCRDRFGGNGHGVWLRPEYLFWTTKGADVPALVTSGGTGVLGQPGTTVIFGANEINDDWRSGGRVSAGFWLKRFPATAIEGNVFALAEEDTTFQANGTAAARLGRPFFNIQLPGEDAHLVPAVGFTNGSIAIQSTTELQGGELLLRHMLNPPSRIPTALLVGYRYMRLDDDLLIAESQTGAPGPTTVSLFDSFDTSNTFHGIDVGVIGEVCYNRWFGELVMKVAFGNTHSKVRIDGSTTTTVAPAAPVTAVGGLLAQSTNIGTFEQNDFAVIPEVGATIGFHITERLKATIGYTFIYWSRVARAGDQIDRDVNVPVVPGPTTLRPEFAFRMTDFWAHGASAGLEYSF